MTTTDTFAPERTRFARNLRDLRKRAGLGGVEAARRARMSQSKISKLENAKLLASPDDVRTLCAIYDATPSETEDLVQIAIELRGVGRIGRVVLSRGMGRLQERIGRLEARATKLRSFQPAMVLGLLQTPAYAACVYGAGGTAEEDAAEGVAARQARRSVLYDPTKEVVLIMSEGALRWQAHSPAVMVEQIEAIVEAARLPNVRIGIVPWTTSVEVFSTHGFHIYDDAAVVFGTETATGVLDDDEDVTAYSDLFARLEEVASFGDDARRELARIGNDYRLLG